MQLIEKNSQNLLVDLNSVLFCRVEEEKYFKYTFPCEVEEISEDYYFEKKFGGAFKKIVADFGYGKIKYANSVILNDNSKLISFYQDSTLKKYDEHGRLIWENGIVGEWDTLYDIAVEDNFVWCAYPTSNTIKKFSLDTFKEVISLGGWEEKIFNYPETINIYGDSLFVCDMGSKRIIKIKLKSYKTEEYMHFNEPVWEYVQLKGRELVRLDSGIYLL